MEEIVGDIESSSWILEQAPESRSMSLTMQISESYYALFRRVSRDEPQMISLSDETPRSKRGDIKADEV